MVQAISPRFACGSLIVRDTRERRHGLRLDLSRRARTPERGLVLKWNIWIVIGLDVILGDWRRSTGRGCAGAVVVRRFIQKFEI